jgi:hypothetical protein
MSEATVTTYKFQTLAARIDSALDLQEKSYGMWNEVAKEAFEVGTNGWIFYALLKKKDGREVTAARKVQSLKVENPEGAKEAKEDAKRIRTMISEKVKARLGESANDRVFVSRVVDSVAAMAGIPKPEANGTSKGGRTHYDHVSEALRALRNHLNEVEPGQCLELQGLWSDIEEAAINDGVLKESD